MVTVRWRGRGAACGLPDMMPQGDERIRAPLRFKNYDGTLNEFCARRCESERKVSRVRSEFRISPKSEPRVPRVFLVCFASI